MEEIKIDDAKVIKINEYVAAGATATMLRNLVGVSAYLISRDFLCTYERLFREPPFAALLKVYRYLQLKPVQDEWDQKLSEQLMHNIFRVLVRCRGYQPEMLRSIALAVPDSDPYYRLYVAIFPKSILTTLDLEKELALLVKSLSPEEYSLSPEEFSGRLSNEIAVKLKQGGYSFPKLSGNDRTHFLEALETLTPREAKVIKMRCGFGDKPQSPEEIAAYFQVAKGRIRQIEAKALRKLRYPLLLSKIAHLGTVTSKIQYLEAEVERLKKVACAYSPYVSLNILDAPTPLIPPADLGTPLEQLELSVRTYNCLRSEGVRTLGELLQKTERDLLRVKNLGHRKLMDIKEMLSNLGYYLMP